MSRPIEVWPLEVVEADVVVWPDMGHPKDSPLNELYPNPYDGTLTVHMPGDIVRWDAVRLASGIAYRKITCTFGSGGHTFGMLAVYGRVIGEKFGKGKWEAVRVDPVPHWQQASAVEEVCRDYAAYLRGLGLSEGSVRQATMQVVFLAEDGWVYGDEIGEDEI